MGGLHLMAFGQLLFSTLDTANVEYHSHVVLNKSLSVCNVHHNRACYSKVSNAQWGELQRTLSSWVHKIRKVVLERQALH